MKKLLYSGLTALMLAYMPLQESRAVEQTLRLSQNGIALVKQFEGYAATQYVDAAGKPTIGYGHLISKGESLEKLTEKEAEHLLKKDLQRAEQAVRKHVKVPLTQNQYDALVSFTYNLGEGNLKNSTLLRKLHMNDYQGAAQEFERWVYAGGKKLTGLEQRRTQEKALFLR